MHRLDQASILLGMERILSFGLIVGIHWKPYTYQTFGEAAVAG